MTWVLGSCCQHTCVGSVSNSMVGYFSDSTLDTTSLLPPLRIPTMVSCSIEQRQHDVTKQTSSHLISQKLLHAHMHTCFMHVSASMCIVSTSILQSISTVVHTLNAAAACLYLLDGHRKYSISFIVDVLANQIHPPCSTTPALWQTGGTGAHGPSGPCYSAAGFTCNRY